MFQLYKISLKPSDIPVSPYLHLKLTQHYWQVHHKMLHSSMQ